MEPVGVGLGAVSLLFQIFSGCVKGYQLFSEAKGLEKSHQFFRVRFITEQHRLLDWATIIGLNEHDESLVITQISRPVALEILDQQLRLMLRYGRLDHRLKPLVKPWIFEENDNGNVANGADTNGSLDIHDLRARFPHTDPLLRRALKHVEITARFPTRLRWAISDKEKLEELLRNLTALNDSLHHLLTSQQLQTLNDHQVRTNYQIIQFNDKLDNLFELIQACSIGASENLEPGYARSGSKVEFKLTELADLARFKAMRSAIETESLTDALRQDLGLVTPQTHHQSVQIPFNRIHLIESSNDADQRRAPAWFNMASLEPWRRVWVEWASPRLTGSSEALTLRRFEALVRLLREDQYTAAFRSLKCHGYTSRRSTQYELQFGLIFEAPSSAGIPEPVSLMHMLKERVCPSLTVRLSLIRLLAESMERLHAVNWLHKGFRSHNIVFFLDADGKVDLKSPYLTGFEYSRPESAKYMSENPEALTAEDLYRHPAVQGGLREDEQGFGYKKHHDIYSLGIIFLEIAYWRPLYELLGYDASEVVRPTEAAKVKELLLNGSYYDAIQARMGDVVAEVWKNCLEGPPALRTDEAEAVDPHISARYQVQFFKLIVESLGQLRM